MNPRTARDETLNLAPLARLGYPCMGRGLGTYRHRTKILPMFQRLELDIPVIWISIRKGGYCIVRSILPHTKNASIFKTEDPS